jgi:hypothetical protein
MTQQLPVDVEQLTPEWVSRALSARHPGVRVTGAEVLGERGSTNHHVRLGLTYDEQAGAPGRLFCKMASLDAAHRLMIGSTGMGLREARFYSDLAESLPIRTPMSYFAEAGADGAFVILLEDLVATGCSVLDGIECVPPDLAAGALTDLAHLHVHFENSARLEAVRPWVTADPTGSMEFTAAMLRQVIDAHRDILSEAYVEVGEMYMADPAAVVGLWQSGPQTLIHGDAHVGNVFIDGSRVGFLDWGLTTIMSPLRDVGYFLSMAMTTEDRRAAERDLVRHYLGVRDSLGGAPIGFDDAWNAIRVHSGYTVLASFLSLVPPYNGEDQREFTDAFRGRSIALLDDLDTVAAMKEALAAR